MNLLHWLEPQSSLGLSILVPGARTPRFCAQVAMVPGQRLIWEGGGGIHWGIALFERAAVSEEEIRGFAFAYPALRVMLSRIRCCPAKQELFVTGSAERFAL